MRGAWGAVLLVAVFPLLSDDLPRDVVQLSGIKRKMAQNLSHITNYTCLETITREQQVPDRKPSRKPVRFHRIDVVRLEVAEVGGDELFSRPGDNRFEKRGVSDLVIGGGLMGNGTFSGFAHDVFNS